MTETPFTRPVVNQPMTAATSQILRDVVHYFRTNKFAADLAACSETNS